MLSESRAFFNLLFEFFFDDFLNLIISAMDFWFLTFGKDFGADRWTGSTREGIGKSTDVDFDKRIGKGESVRGGISEKGAHDFCPDWRGASNTRGDLMHGGVVVVSYPGGDNEVAGIAKGPVIAKIITRTGFNGDLMRGNIENRVTTKGAGAGDGVREDIVDDVGSLGREGTIR